MMPILLVLVVVIAGYAQRHAEDASGQMRTGMEGCATTDPDYAGRLLTVSRFFAILLDAMSQLFFSSACPWAL